MKEQYEKPKVVEIDLEESFSFGRREIPGPIDGTPTPISPY